MRTRIRRPRYMNARFVVTKMRKINRSGDAIYHAFKRLRLLTFRWVAIKNRRFNVSGFARVNQCISIQANRVDFMPGNITCRVANIIRVRRRFLLQCPLPRLFRLLTWYFQTYFLKTNKLYYELSNCGRGG